MILALWDYTFAQLMLSLINQLFFTVNVAYFKMYRDPTEQRMELVNEIMSLIVIESLMALSGDFVNKAKTQTDIGYSMIGLTVLNFAINSVPIGYHIKS